MIFKDALKMGSRLMLMISSHRKQISRKKATYFDRWKLQTLIASRIDSNQSSASELLQIVH